MRPPVCLILKNDSRSSTGSDPLVKTARVAVFWVRIHDEYS